MTPQSKLAASTRIANQEMEILSWLKNNHPEVFTEQKHLDAGTIECAYWHYGRLSALKDAHPSLAEAQKVMDVMREAGEKLATMTRSDGPTRLEAMLAWGNAIDAYKKWSNHD